MGDVEVDVGGGRVVRDLAVYPGSDQVRLDGTDHRLGLDEAPARVVGAMRPFLAGLP